MPAAAPLAVSAPPTAPLPLPAPFGRLLQLPTRSLVALGVAIAMLTGLIWYGLAASREPQWRILYASVSDKDGGAIIAALAQLNVPHKYSEGGAAILVPADKVHDVRLKLASQGLPRGGTVGFELVENQKFGTTQFQERLNFQRGLEGELARSIMALAAVESARVHLALPPQTAFMREQQKPSASVLLQLHAGRTLDRGQVAGIVHLVASSVPELQPRAVSVVDQTGTLLSQAPGESAPNGLDAPQLHYLRQTEQSLAQRIIHILEPIVGPGNVKAQITADMDFTTSESTAEQYGPNQGSSPASVRSQQLSEAPGNGNGGAAGVGGVPGALANQPPATPTSPVNGAPQAIAATAVGGGGGVKRDAITNYEVDKTVKVVRNATGIVKRLSAAVIVNHLGAAGGKPQALPAQQMEQINALVREAIGFSKDRGDSVQVVNAAFSATALPKASELPLWKQPEVLEIVRSVGPWLALPMMALIVVLGLVRPAMKAARATTGGEPRLLETRVHDAIPLPDPVSTTTTVEAMPAGLPGPTGFADAQPAPRVQSRDSQLEGIRQLAQQDPATVANVVRTWAKAPA
ncbi:flagellar basal-body MS-ring/collar protein FliF [Ramlibacter sp.]|uniref:flagellar basal-body MS-ring/collar protein FliF n=1 Tax=Ramlibacter sp. TaxID=1917967 RepID=UPI003D138839